MEETERTEPLSPFGRTLDRRLSLFLSLSLSLSLSLLSGLLRISATLRVDTYGADRMHLLDWLMFVSLDL